MTRRERDDLAQALAEVADGAFVTTADGEIVVWNPAAERIVGYAANEVVGRTCDALLASGDAGGQRLCRPDCHVARLVHGGNSVQTFDIQTRSRSGSPLWLNITATAIGNGDEDALFVHLFREVTAARRLLDRLRDRVEPAVGRAAFAHALTPRELEVLRAVATGADTRNIARLLGLSTATVRNHVRSILEKLGAHSRLQAVAHATRDGILRQRDAS